MASTPGLFCTREQDALLAPIERCCYVRQGESAETWTSTQASPCCSDSHCSSWPAASSPSLPSTTTDGSREASVRSTRTSPTGSGSSQPAAIHCWPPRRPSTSDSRNRCTRRHDSAHMEGAGSLHAVADPNRHGRMLCWRGSTPTRSRNGFRGASRSASSEGIALERDFPRTKARAGAAPRESRRFSIWPSANVSCHLTGTCP